MFASFGNSLPFNIAASTSNGQVVSQPAFMFPQQSQGYFLKPNDLPSSHHEMQSLVTNIQGFGQQVNPNTLVAMPFSVNASHLGTTLKQPLNLCQRGVTAVNPFQVFNNFLMSNGVDNSAYQLPTLKCLERISMSSIGDTTRQPSFQAIPLTPPTKIKRSKTHSLRCSFRRICTTADSKQLRLFATIGGIEIENTSINEVPVKVELSKPAMKSISFIQQSSTRMSTASNNEMIIPQNHDSSVNIQALKEELLSTLSPADRLTINRMKASKKFNFSKNVIKQFLKIINTQTSYIYQQEATSMDNSSQNTLQLISDPSRSDLLQMRHSITQFLKKNTYTHASIKKIMTSSCYSLYFRDFLENNSTEWIASGKTKYKEEQKLMVDFLNLCTKDNRLLVFLSGIEPKIKQATFLQSF